MTAGDFEACTETTAAGTRCARTGTWVIEGAQLRPQCYQHALARARSDGMSRLVDLAHARLVDVADVPRRQRRLVLPTTEAEVIDALPTLQSLDELARVIGVVIEAGPKFGGFGDRDSVLRSQIRVHRDRLKATAAAAEITRNGGGWKPKGVGAIVAGNMRRAGVDLR